MKKEEEERGQTKTLGKRKPGWEDAQQAEKWSNQHNKGAVLVGYSRWK